MLTTSDISKETIRANLLARAKAYAESQRRALSSIGADAVNDSKFFARIEEGGNFTVETYQRVLDWIDQQERAQ